MQKPDLLFVLPDFMLKLNKYLLFRKIFSSFLILVVLLSQEFIAVPLAFAQETPVVQEAVASPSPEVSPEPVITTNPEPSPEVSPSPEAAPSIEPAPEVSPEPTSTPATETTSTENSSLNESINSSVTESPAPMASVEPSPSTSPAPATTPESQPESIITTISAEITEATTLSQLFNLFLNTNKGDYQPGDFVKVTGSGFLPEETVSLTFNETPYQHLDNVVLTTANENGEIYNQDFLINQNDIDATFTLVARGQTSGHSATTIFTDAAVGPVSTVSVTNLSPSNVSVGQTMVPLISFTLRSTASGEKFKKVLVEYTGTTKSDISKLYLYRESSTSGGSFDSSVDVQMDNSTPPGSGVVFTLDPTDYSMAAHTDYQFYVVADLSSSAVASNTVDVKVTQDQITLNSTTWPNATDTTLFNPTGSSTIVADTSAPTTVDNVDSSWHSNTVTITLTCNDGSGSGCADTYHTTNGSTPTTGSSNSNPFTLSSAGTYTIKYFSKDNAGNTEIVKTATNTVKIDTANPSTSDSGTDTLWHTSPVTINFTCTDASSGCDKTYYTTDGSTPTTSSVFGSSVTLSSDGTYTIKYRSTDVAGNLESSQSAAHTVKIDVNAPTGSITSPINNSYSTSNPSFSVSATDGSGSGIDSVKFQYKKSTDSSYSDLNTDTSSAYNASWSGVTLISGTLYNLQAVITDNAGFTTTVNGVSFTYDNTIPTGSFKINGDATYASSTSVTLNFSGVSSDATQLEIRNGISGSFQSPVTYVNPYTYVVPTSDGTKTVSVRFTDLTGNQSTGTISDSIILETVAPLTTSSGTDTNWHNSDVTVILTCVDTTAGCATTYYTTDGSTPTTSSATGNSITLSNSGTYTINYFSKDNAGNLETVKTAANTVKIDKTAPVVSEITRVTSPTIDAIPDYTFTTSEAGTITYGGDCTSSTTSASLGNNTVTFAALSDGIHNNCTVAVTDSAGNISSALSITAFTVDTTGPSTPGTPSTTSPTQNTTPTVSWSTSTDSGSGLKDPAYTLEWSLSSNFLSGVSSASTNSASFTQTSPLAKGTWYFRVRASDQLDNVSAYSVPGSVIIDPNIPVGGEDSATATKNTPLDILRSTLLLNDTDADSDSLSITAVSNAVHGTVALTSVVNFITMPGMIPPMTFPVTIFNVTFTPATGFVGVGGFDYTVSDGNLTSTVHVTVTVNPPVTVNDVLLSVNTTVTSSNPNVVVGGQNQDSTITVPGSVTNSTLDLSHLTSAGGGITTATIPQGITIQSSTTIGTVEVKFPAGIQIQGASSDWDGIINNPKLLSSSTVSIPGSGNTTESVVEIGFGNVPLTLDMGVRILMPGQAGKLAASVQNGVTTLITTTCTADTQSAANALPAGGDCKMDVGSDLVIWTKHFTQFVTYSQTTASVGSSGQGLSADNGGGSAPVCSDAKPGSAPTLLSAVAKGNNQVTLTWSKAADPTTYYLITFGTSAGAQQYGNPNVGGSGSTSYTISGLSGGATYYFRVRAGNGCAPGDFSNEVSATPGGAVLTSIPAGFAAGVLGVNSDQQSPDGPQDQVLGTAKADAVASSTPAPTKSSGGFGFIGNFFGGIIRFFMHLFGK